MTEIKICGLTRQEDIEAVNRYKPDYVGFVFWKKSKRFVDEETAEKLKESLDRHIKAVGVFVDEDISFVRHLLDKGIIDMAQLHGHEDDDYIRKLQKQTDKKIIKAFLIKDKEDVARANESSADYILLDVEWEMAKPLTGRC